MKRAILPILLLFTLAAQGVAIELLPPAIKFADIYIIPHWLLMMLILQVTYEETDNTLIPILYGAIFGLITDIVYTGILGIYMFVLALSVYVVQLLHRLFQTNYITNVFFSIVSVLVMEIALLFIYTFLTVPTMTFANFALLRLLPTTLANVIFISIIFYPMKQLFHWLNK